MLYAPKEELNNVETLPIYELQGSLLVHEQKMKVHKEEGQVLKVSSLGTGKFQRRLWQGKTTCQQGNNGVL